MDETQEEEGADPEGTTTPGTERLQSNPDYDSNDESPSAAVGTSEGPAGSRDCTPDHTQVSAFDGVLCYIHELQESQSQLEECFESLRAIYQRDYSLILEALEEEQIRREYLEEQLTDVTELHQNEILNLKKQLATKEETIADQSYGTTEDFNEALQTCETRLLKPEQQQQEEEPMQSEKWANTASTWKTNECTTICYGCPFGADVNSGQLCGPVCEHILSNALCTTFSDPFVFPVEAP